MMMMMTTIYIRISRISFLILFDFYIVLLGRPQVNYSSCFFNIRLTCIQYMKTVHAVRCFWSVMLLLTDRQLRWSPASYCGHTCGISIVFWDIAHDNYDNRIFSWQQCIIWSTVVLLFLASHRRSSLLPCCFQYHPGQRRHPWLLPSNSRWDGSQSFTGTWQHLLWLWHWQGGIACHALQIISLMMCDLLSDLLQHDLATFDHMLPLLKGSSIKVIHIMWLALNPPSLDCIWYYSPRYFCRQLSDCAMGWYFDIEQDMYILSLCTGVTAYFWNPASIQ